MPAHKRNMGMVFQSYSLFPNLTVADNVEFGLRTRKVDAAERAQRASPRCSSSCSSPRIADRYPHQLSGGQQQRVALARALAIQPSVLLLDEPLSALDAKVRASLRDEIRRIQTELGITTLFVTHDQEEALAISDRIGVMSQGRLEQLGTPDRDLPPPVDRVRRPLHRLDEPAARPTCSTAAPSGCSTSRSTVGRGTRHGRRHRRAMLLVRPEDTHFAARRQAGLPGTVASLTFEGVSTTVGVRLERGRRARRGARGRVGRGQVTRSVTASGRVRRAHAVVESSRWRDDA